MAGENKDDQLIFQFTGCEGPESPALEPEDDSLLDLYGNPGASPEPEEEEEAWSPALPPVEEAEKERAAASSTQVQPVQTAKESKPMEPIAQASPEASPVSQPVQEQAAAQEPKAVETAAPVATEAPKNEERAKAAKPEEPQALKPSEIRQAALAWMAKQSPMAIATKVPTRLKRFCASVAAFWSEPGRRKRLLKPQRTAIVETRATRDECFSESVSNSELLPALREAKAKKIELEAVIRVTEPFLKDADQLFAEIETWNYARSSNKDYKRALKRIEELERSLNKGSKFERIREARVANELYLAVPEGVVKPEELADGWGLIYVSPSLETKLVKKASAWECPEDNMMHLAQNVGASAMRDVLFANGVHLSADGTVSLRRPPRMRNKPAKL